MLPHSSISRIRVAAGFAAFLIVVWVGACLILWWAYDVSAIVNAGSESQSHALVFVGGMAAILGGLVAIATVLIGNPVRQRAAIKSAGALIWRSILLLGGYGLVVVSWRQFWTPLRPASDTAMFLPVLGTVNARFFAEVGWLIYLIEVVPVLSIASGILYALGVRVFSTHRSGECIRRP